MCYGQENVGAALQSWTARHRTGSFYIRPGQFIFNTVKEVREYATRWLWTCNNERPNMSIGAITPAMRRRPVQPN